MAVIEPLILAREDVEALIPPLPEIVEIVRDVYREAADGTTDTPTKIGIHPDQPLSFLHAMPAWLGARREIGMKWVSYFPGSNVTADSDATALIILNEPDTGMPIAIMEAMHLTNARTAASGVFAAHHLAPSQPTHIGLIGCGALPTWTLPELVRRYDTVRSVRVVSKRRESRTNFASRLSKITGLSITPVETVREAVEEADIVVSAIPQGLPPVAKGAWIKPGALVIAYDIVGTWDDDAIARFGLLATDGLPRLENIVANQRTEAVLPTNVVSFESLAKFGHPSSSAPKGSPMLAVPTGVASLDIALASEIYRRATATGRGHRVKLM